MLRIAFLAGLALIAGCAEVDGYGDYGYGYGGYGGYGYRSPAPYWGPSYAPAPYAGPAWRGHDHRPGPFGQGNTSRDPGGGGFFRPQAPAARMAPPPVPRGPLGPGPGGGPRMEQGAD